MLKNYLTLALRTLRRRPGTTAINVVGLGVGLAACMLVGLWVQHELSYDTFHPAADRIYRVALDGKLQDREIRGAITPAPLARALADETPGVEQATRFQYDASQTFRVGNQASPKNRVVLADAFFFSVFGGFDQLHGTLESALQDADAVVLTASVAERLFGTRNAVGETLQMGGATRRVTAILEDVPEASHFHFDAVARQTLSPQQRATWVGNNWRTYVKLLPDAAPEAFDAQLDALVERRVAPQLSEFLGQPFSQFVAQGARYRLFAQPLTRIHLHSTLDYELEPGGSIDHVYAFSAIALFILGLACINFMNLATARAAERITEVGLRKSFGAARRQLAAQFLGEALLVTTMAAGGALVLTSLALPVFNRLAGMSLHWHQLTQPAPLLGGVAVIGLVALVAGSYPALALSRFEPAAALKAGDRHSTGGASRRLRQGLVVFQFATSMVLIVCTLVVWQQFDFLQQKRLGLDTERVVVVERAWVHSRGLAAFAEHVASLPGVAAAATADGLFDTDVSSTEFIPDDAPIGALRSANYLDVGFGFVEAMGVTVQAGRAFDPARRTDSSAVLVNAAAARAFGWEEAAGHRLRAPQPDGSIVTYEVIGVVDDFHYQSLRQRVQPLVLKIGATPARLYIRTEAGATTAALDAVREAWAETASGEPFQFVFLDQAYAQLHRDTQQTGRLFTLFAGLAILIACLGLFGLAAYTAQQRTKEIGIRKALGATTASIAGLLSKDFLRLVVVAVVLAAPLAYFGMQHWLSGFAYRISIELWVFVAAGVTALLIAALTVSTQALRAARANPVDALRND